MNRASFLKRALALAATASVAPDQLDKFLNKGEAYPSYPSVLEVDPNKVKWFEDELIPVVTNGAWEITPGGNSIRVGGSSVYYRPNDLVRVDLTGEILRVKKIVGGWMEVQREYGEVKKRPFVSDDTTLVKLGNSKTLTLRTTDG